MSNPKDKPTSSIRKLVHTQLLIYPDYVKVYIPHKPLISQPEGYEKSKKPGLTRDIDEYETDEERSLRRSRRFVRDYVECNEFDMFATFTFDPKKVNRMNVSECKNVMSTWLKNQRKRNGKFKYIIVAEYHKNGALHFHALFGGYKGKIIEATNSNTNKPIYEKGKLVYEFAEYKSGFSNMMRIDDNKNSKTKLAFYVQKYMTKDMPLIFGKNRYWVSKGLKKPIKIDDPEPWYRVIEPDYISHIDYGTNLYFDRKKIEIFLP